MNNGGKFMKDFMKLIGYLLVFILGFLMIGCSNNNPNSVETNNIGNLSQSTVVGGSKGGVTDPEQPERTVDVYGSVRSIQGNLIVVAKMLQPQSGKDLSEEEREAKRAQMQSLSEEERQKVKAAGQVLTGETVQVLIPVGTPIKIKQNQTQGGGIVEGALTDIKQGVTLSVWTEDSAANDQVTAEYVRISGLN